jgi:predicted transcriptional regulator
MPTLVVTEEAMTNRPAGTQELRFLQFIAQHGPISAGHVAEQLGAELGLARTTVQTVLERLRRKRHLARRKVDGVYLYASAASYEQLMRTTVGQFVDRALAGSISPFVAYLAERGEVSDAELKELRSIVGRRDAARKGGS